MSPPRSLLAGVACEFKNMAQPEPRSEQYCSHGNSFVVLDISVALAAAHKDKDRFKVSRRLSARYPSLKKPLKIGVEGLVMATKRRRAFDTKSFLARVGNGRSVGNIARARWSFRRGIPAMRCFKSKKAGPNSPSFPSRARKRSLPSSARTIFSARDVWPDRRGG
jgi:hypothetical protein